MVAEWLTAVRKKQGREVLFCSGVLGLRVSKPLPFSGCIVLKLFYIHL